MTGREGEMRKDSDKDPARPEGLPDPAVKDDQSGVIPDPDVRQAETFQQLLSFRFGAAQFPLLHPAERLQGGGVPPASPQPGPFEPKFDRRIDSQEEKAIEFPEDGDLFGMAYRIDDILVLQGRQDPPGEDPETSGPPQPVADFDEVNPAVIPAKKGGLPAHDIG